MRFDMESCALYGSVYGSHILCCMLLKLNIVYACPYLCASLGLTVDTALSTVGIQISQRGA